MGNSNIGFLSEKRGIEHFIKMLHNTAPQLSDKTLADLKAALLKADK